MRENAVPLYLLVVLAGLVAVVLVVRGVAAQRRRRQAVNEALERLEFRPCLDQTSWLVETVTSIENNRGFRYEVRDPRRRAGEPAVYYYVKVRHGGTRDQAVAEEEILFPLARPSTAGLVLAVKPSSLTPGLATRLLGAVATGPWDSQPDDLHRLELPPYLRETNLLGALGPPGASLHDLVDTGTLNVVQGLGDVGVLIVRFRDAWCSVTGANAQVPFRLEEFVARIRPLLLER